MKYKLHDNQWTVIFDESYDIKTITPEEILEVSKLLATNTLVIFKKQKLTVEEEIKIIKMFKNPRQFYPELNDSDRSYMHCVVPNSEEIIVRVTGGKDENGNPGFAGDEDELIWHVNDPIRKERHPLVWLRSVYGSKGSRTTWNNNIFSYEHLDEATKEKLKDLKIVVKHAYESDELVGFTPDLIHTNIAGKTGLYFPFNQIKRFVGLTDEESKEIMDPLIEYTTQEQFCYHHDWDEGDITIGEQWLGVHKRWPFKGMSTRLLHRAVFDFPDQDYK